MNLNELTIKQASDGLRERKFSVSELVADCLEAIKDRDGDIHAYLDVFESAKEEAKKADDMIVDVGERLPALFGIPLAMKDNILIEGMRCTAGSRILENYTAAYDATVVRKLKNHGAIFLGKTNMDEFAMGSSTENSAFGPTRNPRDISRVPGGSSGGSAAAVGAGMCLGALGSDTGGSIRQPASFCGIVGLKPTYGRVSRHGLIAMASSLDAIGPMTKTVEDARMIFDAIAGKDGFDSTTVDAPPPRTRPFDIKGLQIGVPKEYFSSGLDPHVADVISAAAKKMEKAGAEIVEISLPHASYALPVYYIIVPSEVSANLARFDGIRYGASAAGQASSLLEVYTRTRGEYLGPEVKRRIMLGTYALSAGYYDAYYKKAQQVRRLIREDFEKAFARVDVIIGPTTPTSAFGLAERTDDPLQMYLADIYTVAINLAGIPALSLPAGSVAKDGVSLPVGLQIIGPWLCEQLLFDVGMEVEKIIWKTTTESKIL